MTSLTFVRPIIRPLGDRALTVTFGDNLTLDANRRAIAAARAIGQGGIAGVTEVAPNLVSVFVGYDPERVAFYRLSGEIALLLNRIEEAEEGGAEVGIETRYGGDSGPDLAVVAEFLGFTPAEFTARHARASLRVLAVGFAPGFVYCGVHDPDLLVPRRQELRQAPKGSVLFAAGQTALCATPIPTGWHVIGRTDFDNFDPSLPNPVRLSAGDRVRFTEARA